MLTQLKAFLSKIPGKTKATFALLIIAVLIVWYVLPLIPVGGVHPFGSLPLRSIVIGFLIVIYLIKLLLDVYQKHQAQSFALASGKVKQSYQISKNIFRNLYEALKSWLKETQYRLAQSKKRRRLCRIPWYVVMGTPGAGKSTVLNNTGLHYARPEDFAEEANRYLHLFPDFDWKFSEQAVLVDLIAHQKEEDKANARRFFKFLRKERHTHPINGVLLTISLPDLILYTHQQRIEFVEEISHTIREMHTILKTSVPVYLIFNKCDLIEGFLEFFTDLSREEVNQVWGMTFPLDVSSNMMLVQETFRQEYADLVEHLRNRVMHALDSEKTERGRELIQTFPQQMQLLKQPIENFIGELFATTRYPKALQLRGCYFTSADQESGDPFDFVTAAMSKKFQLVTPQFERQRRSAEFYFMRHLFLGAIYPEAAIMGESERSKHRRQAYYTASLITLPLILIFAFMEMQQGYEENAANLKAVNGYIDHYQAAVSTLKPQDVSLTPLLPALNQLNDARNVYMNDGSWGKDFLFATAHIENHLTDTLQRALHLYFLPRVAAQIETSLNGNIADDNVLYATLKGYLAFDANSNSSGAYVKAPMEYQWAQTYLTQPKTNQALRYYLDFALQIPVDKFPLDDTLVKRTRAQLEQIIPSQRAYGLLELGGQVSNIMPLALANEVGSNFYFVFTEKDQKRNNIPALYTAQGYQGIFESEHKHIANEVADDNQEIGLVNNSDTPQTAEQIRSIMASTYNKTYVDTWNHALSNITVKPFSSINEAVTVLNTLVGNQSPLSKLMDIVYDNSSSVRDDNVQVSQYFDPVNEYSRNDSTTITWRKTLNDLTAVRDYFVTLQQASNQNQAAFDQAVAAVQGKGSPIQALSQDAVLAPEPVKTWLNSIVVNCWKIILTSAHQQMNEAWRNNVIKAYDMGVRGRYPLNATADSEVSIDSFNQLFGNGGALQTYFNTYIKPFVDTSGAQWKLANFNGHSIDIPEHTVLDFQRAAAITTDYFQNGAKTSAFLFTVQPLTLDANASSVLLSMGTQTLSYSHGPQTIANVQWPLPSGAQTASIQINDFNDNQYGASTQGPWAIFQLFDKGQLAAQSNNGTYLFTATFNGYTATYTITGTASLSVFQLQDIKGFKLPKYIAPLKKRHSDSDSDSSSEDVSQENAALESSNNAGSGS